MSLATLSGSASTPAFEFEDFSFSFTREDRRGLNNVSLRVAPGEFVIVCGRSGSGKSTLLRAIGGLVPHHFGGVAAGEAAICGRDLRTHRPAELAAYCGTVMQDPEVQVVMGKVRNEIAFPLENLGWEAPAIKLAVEETATALGIESLLDRRTSELSGGELQRVVLAAALAPRPPILALDEPTSQLDPVAADDLIATLARLNADWGTTVVLADHRFERALEVADRVVAIEAGSVVVDGSPTEFLAAVSRSDQHRWLLPPSADLCDRLSISPIPVGAKETRRALGSMLCADRRWSMGSVDEQATAIELKAISHRYPDSATKALDSVSLTIRTGERVVLMGANGSGKSTLLRIARGVQRSDSGSIETAGEVGLLLQNPNDYLIHETVAEESPRESRERFGLGSMGERDPRDLSGGERQRLALSIVMQDQPCALLLDEPSRGMDRLHKAALAEILNDLARDGVAIVVATHDAEFAALFADRAVLLAKGAILADGPAREILGGGWHFATEIARLLPGSGALTAAEGAELLAGPTVETVDEQSALELQEAAS